MLDEVSLEMMKKYSGLDEIDLEIISKNAAFAYFYAANVIKERFPEGEEVIGKNVFYLAYYYAVNVLNGRFELGESIIKNSPVRDDYILFLREKLSYDDFILFKLGFWINRK